MIVDPWGEVLARAPMEGEHVIAAELDLARQDEIREKLPSLANRVDAAYRWPRARSPPDGHRARSSAPDKRRMILDAAVRVFARQGFHHCRVSDVADEAGVAYGLVYHYFDSKEEILNTLFLERWQIMLDAIGEIDSRDLPSRDKLRSVAGFIIDSYRHDPDLMKVIIVEVTRAANSFGAVHLDEIRKAYEGIAGIVEAAREEGSFKSGIPSEFAAMCFYGAIEQLLTGWIFEVLPRTDEDYERAKDLIVEAICGGLENGATSAPQRLLESGAYGQRHRQAAHVGRPPGRRGRTHHDRREPHRHRDLGKGLQGGPADRLMADEQPTTVQRARQGAASSAAARRPDAARRGHRDDPFAERPEAFVGAAFAGGLALALIMQED